MDGLVRVGTCRAADRGFGGVVAGGSSAVAAGGQHLYSDRRGVAGGDWVRAISRSSRSAGCISIRNAYLSDGVVLSKASPPGQECMKYSRREALGLAGGAALALVESGCLRGRPQARIFPSRTALPKAFEVALPILPVLKPSGSDATSDCYEMAVRPASASILPGLTTPIWGYNGTFPGPVIEARRGRKVSLRLKNELPVPIVNHLHGGRTPPE